MTYSFGDFTFDTESRELVRPSGDVVRLPPKTFDVLRLLIEARPRVVSKMELLERLWPGTHVVSASLFVIVGDIRAALGDSARNARFLRTHHGVGYSFTDEVVEFRAPVDATGWEGPARVLQVGNRQIALGVGRNLVGRDERAQVLLDHLSVSRRHAEIVVDGVVTTVRDLGSRNGTFVGGKRLDGDVCVNHRDTITFGAVETTLLIDDRGEVSTVAIEVDG
jgi:DNA-binding winged helix-turn-helix (wHTH) protein